MILAFSCVPFTVGLVDQTGASTTSTSPLDVTLALENITNGALYADPDARLPLPFPIRRYPLASPVKLYMSLSAMPRPLI